MFKRIFLLTLLFIPTVISAQIKRDVFGITLGVSTQRQVESLFSEEYNVIDKGVQPETYFQFGLHKLEITRGDKYIRFGGVNWNSVWVYFFNNKVESILFIYDGDAYESKFNTIKDKVESKYGSTFSASTKNETDGDREYWIDDGHIRIMIFMAPRIKRAYISYTDLAIECDWMRFKTGLDDL